MNKFGLGLAVLPFLAGGALAGQPLTDKQMDTVTAGFVFSVEEQTNFSTILIDVNQPAADCAGLCYLTSQAGFVSVQAAFGNISSMLPSGG
jgi:hypothetical protein